jgi:hypothetical protein
MKTLTYSAAVVACGAALVSLWPQTPSPALAQPADAKKDQRTIHASGTSSVRVAPDSARLYFTISTNGTTVKAARMDNDEAMKKTKAALMALNIKDLKMKTVDVNVRTVEERPDKLLSLPKVIGYSVVHQFTVLVENDNAEELSTQANKVLDAALESGVNGFNHMQLFRKKTTELELTAKTKAVENAMENAKALAKGIPVENLEIIEVKESSNPYSYYYGMQNAIAQNAAPRDGDSDTLTLGVIEVKKTVTIVCKY